MQQGILIGLVGPSGVGKGFIKDYLKTKYPDFVELTVVTTRGRRETDGVDRETDVPIGVFFQRSDQGEIVFAHQPFGVDGDWYGFQQEQIRSHLEMGYKILTEVHADNAAKFHSKFQSQVALFGLVSNQEYLELNLNNRHTESTEDQQTRLQFALQEMTKIHELHDAGVIAELVTVSSENKIQVPDVVCKKVEAVIAERESNTFRSKELE
jgi:guanylate kinase